MNSFNRPSHSPSLLRLLSLVTGIATLCPSQHTEAAGAITGVGHHARLDMIPNLNWELDVPVGQGYYDDTTLGEEYRGSLFVAN